MKNAKRKSTTERPFKVDYAGVWPGHCSTRHSAVEAAERHLQRDGYTVATIIDKRTNADVAHCRWDGTTLTVKMVKPLRKLIKPK